MLGLENASSEEERMRIMAPSPIQNAAPFEGLKFRLRLARLGTAEIGQQACIPIFQKIEPTLDSSMPVR
jgi:hypothetical protein